MAERIDVSVRQGLGIVAVMARRGASVDEIGAILGTVPPDGPRAHVVGGRAILGISPRSWLIVQESAPPLFGRDMAEALRGLASVSDQSSAYTVLRLSGPGARTVLQRGVAIDLAPEAFSSGAVAVTAIAHIGVILRCTDAAPSYDVAIFRSFSGSFRDWLDGATAAL